MAKFVSGNYVIKVKSHDVTIKNSEDPSYVVGLNISERAKDVVSVHVVNPYTVVFNCADYIVTYALMTDGTCSRASYYGELVSFDEKHGALIVCESDHNQLDVVDIESMRYVYTLPQGATTIDDRRNALDGAPENIVMSVCDGLMKYVSPEGGLWAELPSGGRLRMDEDTVYCAAQLRNGDDIVLSYIEDYADALYCHSDGRVYRVEGDAVKVFVTDQWSLVRVFLGSGVTVAYTIYNDGNVTTSVG